MRIDRLRQNYEMEIQWRAFPLHPEIPEEGLTLEDLFAGRNVDIPGIRRRLKQVADELGLPLGERHRSYNSRLAQELAKWTESKGRGDEFHEAVFRAYFVDGRNIGKVDTLVDLAQSAGLPAKNARNVLRMRTFKDAVDADWSQAMDLGVTAVPTFVLNNRMVVGAQPYEVLEQFLKANHIGSRIPETGGKS